MAEIRKEEGGRKFLEQAPSLIKDFNSNKVRIELF